MTNFEIARALRNLADAIESGDQSSLGKAAPVMSVVPFPSRKRRSTKQRLPAAKIDRDRIGCALTTLSELPNRDSGIEFLEHQGFSKNELIALARESSVHFTKSDDIARLQSRIVEAIIGAKLSSIAIRGSALR